MQSFFSNFKLIFILVLVFSCGTVKKINTLKPEPSLASKIDLKIKNSFVNIPVNITLKNIQKLLNENLDKLIYIDDNIEDDDLKIKLWKQGTITVKNNDKRIELAFPLKAEVDYRFGTNKLGFDMFTTESFEFNGTVTLVSAIGLDQWYLKTQTRLKSIKWHEKPTMSLFGKKLSITRLVNSAIKYFKDDIEKRVDDAVAESLDFKPYVLDVIDKISQPIELNRDYNSWLRIVPEEIYVTNSKVDDNGISFLMGLKCKIETHIGKEPSQQFDNSIALKPVKTLPNKITANLLGISTYKSASKIITKNFKGYEMGSGKKTVYVKKVNLWHKNNQLIVALDIIGKISGTLYLSGMPSYDKQTKEIYFENLDYVLDTKNVIAKSANFFANQYILKEIKKRCRYSISDLLSESETQLLSFLNNYSPVEGVFVNGKIDKVNYVNTQLTNDAILVTIEALGEVNVEVSGL